MELSEGCLLKAFVVTMTHIPVLSVPCSEIPVDTRNESIIKEWTAVNMDLV
jgi:hypothetical protein